MKAKRWIEQYKGSNSKMTQKEANELFEGPSVDMPKRYANTMLMFLVTLFYLVLDPAISLIAFLGTVFSYWIEKYLLLRRHKIPEHMSAQMCIFFTYLIPPSMLIYSGATFGIVMEMSDGANYHGQWGFYIALLFMAIPTQTLIRKCFPIKVKRDHTITYDDVKLNFVMDYDRCNPITEREAQM